MSQSKDCTIIYDGKRLTGEANTPLVDFLEAHDIDLPHVCYHPSLGPLQTCDTSWVEVDGELKRGCTLRSVEGLTISSQDQHARATREEGMDRLLSKHELYYSVCEHNTGDCTLHETKANLYPLKWQEPDEAVDDEYDLSMDNGRMLEHFQGTNQSGRTEGIWQQTPYGFVEISPELAAERGIEEGTWVRLTSRRDSVDMPVVITDRVAGKTVFVPIHHGKIGINALTGEHHDPDVHTPAYKETAVKLKVLVNGLSRDGTLNTIQNLSALARSASIRRARTVATRHREPAVPTSCSRMKSYGTL